MDDTKADWGWPDSVHCFAVQRELARNAATPTTALRAKACFQGRFKNLPLLRFGGILAAQKIRATQVGVTRQTVIAMEGGGYAPSLALALRIAKVFDKPVEEVFWLEE